MARSSDSKARSPFSDARWTMLPLPISRPPPPGLVPSCAEAVCWACCRNRRLDSSDGNHQAHSRHGGKFSQGACCCSMAGNEVRELKLRKNPNCRFAARIARSPNSLTTTNSAVCAAKEAPGPSVQVPEITPRELKSRAGSWRRHIYPGCARAARIPDLQSQGAPHSARRA